jgi:hypothetical protein
MTRTPALSRPQAICFTTTDIPPAVRSSILQCKTTRHLLYSADSTSSQSKNRSLLLIKHRFAYPDNWDENTWSRTRLQSSLRFVLHKYNPILAMCLSTIWLSPYLRQPAIHPTVKRSTAMTGDFREDKVKYGNATLRALIN